MGYYFLILAIVALIVIILGAKTSLLKDIIVINDPGNPAGAVVDTEKKIGIKKQSDIPFSWSRTQLAFWTVIIFSSFIYLFFKFDEVPGLANVNLILLGIVIATTASARLIDDSQKKNGDLSQGYPSEGFLRDILSDKNGVSIHRLQNVLWTIAVGIIYIQFVATSKSLPDETVITDNLLILMGISTGAYVGIKTTENSK
jgi:hypothetical protein